MNLNFMKIVSGYLFLFGITLSVQAAVQIQDGADNFLAFQGEDFDSIINPDAANDVQNSVEQGSAESPARIWTQQADITAINNSTLAAPPSPHKQQTDTSKQESVAIYMVRFVNQGTYHVYFRASNDGTPGSGSTDSLWCASSFGSADPDDQFNTGSTGNYVWNRNTGVSFTINAGNVNTDLEFRIGVRENDARLDAIVFSTDSGLTGTDLDNLFPSPPVGGGPCVSTVTELHDALSTATPGTVICMADGTWFNADIIFDGRDSLNGTGGTAGNPITLTAETPGSVILSGSSRIRIAGEYMVVSGLKFENGNSDGSYDVIEFRNGSSSDPNDLASNCRLTSCAMVNFNPPSDSTNYKWVSVYGLNNEVDHCHFSGMNHIGVQLTVWLRSGAPANNTHIHHNYFANRTEGSGNGYETIRIGTSAVSSQDSDAIVEYNYFEACDGEIEIISNKSVGNIYRYNTFVDCKGQLTLRHGSACEVYGNFFFGAGASNSSGVRIIGPDHRVYNNYFENLNGSGFRGAIVFMKGVPGSPLNRYLQAVDCEVVHNTIVNCNEPFVIGEESSEGDTTLPPLDCIIANNIVDGTTQVIEYINTPPINMTYEGNIFDGSSLGITNPGGISEVDPQLSVGGDGLLRPESLSPAISGAVGTYSYVTDDMDGQTRTPNEDVGADERDAVPGPRGPLNDFDVGPDWFLVPVELSSFSIE